MWLTLESVLMSDFTPGHLQESYLSAEVHRIRPCHLLEDTTVPHMLDSLRIAIHPDERTPVGHSHMVGYKGPD